MTDYRRNRVPGGTYAFTANLRDRRSTLLVTAIDALRHAIRATRRRYPFHIDAWVVLPDHMHCIWTLPDGDINYPDRWKHLKTVFTQTQTSAANRRPSLIRRGEAGIWQRRYWEHTIRTQTDYAAHMDYIHFNPVKHGHVSHPADWPYSTFAHCVAAGLYPADWSDHPDTFDLGERPA